MKLLATVAVTATVKARAACVAFARDSDLTDDPFLEVKMKRPVETTYATLVE